MAKISDVAWREREAVAARIVAPLLQKNTKRKAAITAAQWEARAIAAEECADHLQQTWTDDPVEREQGEVLEAQLRKMAKRWYRKAEGR